MPKSAQGLIFVLLSSLCYALTGLVSKVPVSYTHLDVYKRQPLRHNIS